MAHVSRETPRRTSTYYNSLSGCCAYVVYLLCARWLRAGLSRPLRTNTGKRPLSVHDTARHGTTRVLAKDVAATAVLAILFHSSSWMGCRGLDGREIPRRSSSMRKRNRTPLKNTALCNVTERNGIAVRSPAAVLPIGCRGQRAHQHPAQRHRPAAAEPAPHQPSETRQTRRARAG
jgi:Trk-type K+ transport system membrane component